MATSKLSADVANAADMVNGNGMDEDIPLVEPDAELPLVVERERRRPNPLTESAGMWRTSSERVPARFKRGVEEVRNVRQLLGFLAMFGAGYAAARPEQWATVVGLTVAVVAVGVQLGIAWKLYEDDV